MSGANKQGDIENSDSERKGLKRWMKIVTSKDLREALEQLTKHDIYDIERGLQFKVKAFLHSSVNASREEMFKDVFRFVKEADNEDRKKLIEAVKAKIAEKAQYPVRGEVPGTRYIKWSDFTSLPSYSLISRAVSYPGDYHQRCDPQTKDGYVSVHAIYNMSAWAGWKSSSLDPQEMAIAMAIDKLPLHTLMQLNKGRRKDQPALFPAGLLPIREVPQTVSKSKYLGNWKPGDFAIYSDFGLRSLYIVRVLEWPEEKGDRFVEVTKGEHMSYSMPHDRSDGDIRAQVVDTTLVDWDFSWGNRNIPEFSREGTVHYYYYGNLYHNIEELIGKEGHTTYPEVQVRMLYDLRRHPGWIMLAAYGLRKQ